MTKTMHTFRGYVFTIEYDPNPPSHIVDFPDLPDIITSGSSLPDAFSNACEALDLYVEALEQLGRSPPEPRRRLVVELAGTA
jgi:predicted RNase H-like HicB family nuclease